MKKKLIKICAVAAGMLLILAALPDFDAHARAGRGRSFGSRGTRSFSPPSRTYSQPSPSRDQSASPYRSNPYQQQQSGGFLRGIAGGVLGGLLGGMLFRSLGFAGGGAAGGGIGLFDILLIVGIGYLIYRFIKKKRAENYQSQNAFSQQGYQQDRVEPFAVDSRSFAAKPDEAAGGLAYIRQMDASFDENRFTDGVMDTFFKVQGAWMNRDLSSAAHLLTDEMRRVFQEDIDAMIRDKRVNRLENIAVRQVEIAEAWQESGQDFITARIYANLLDYTTDDMTGEIVSGSKTDPVKFEEYWTFSRPVGNNPWKLSAINQS
ncbi:MAG: import inner rane translocase, subunit Tim44 [Geobacteraceae bacterium]|jgi:predicted lipid-binding transport protein (Tim44 family)|nr:import inner rane translocase, subunit Tim44 [Geobacteraceae bacterium]